MLLGDLKGVHQIERKRISQRTLPMLSIGSTVPCAYWQQEPARIGRALPQEATWGTLYHELVSGLQWQRCCHR